MHGYDVSSGMCLYQVISPLSFFHMLQNLVNYVCFACADSFCWFLHHEDIRDQIQINHEYFSSAMLNVYRATDLTFPGEYDLQDARSFSKKLLEKTKSVGTRDQTHVITFNYRVVIRSFY